MPLHFIAYIAAIAIYAIFVWFGKAPAEGFIAVLAGVISHSGTANQQERVAKAAMEAANKANQPPPPIDPSPTITEQHQRDSTLTGAQGGFARISLLPVIAIISALVLVGCAGMCDPNESHAQCAGDIAEDVGAGVIVGGAIVLDAEAPQTTTTTSTCTKDRRGDSQCITTKQSY